MHRAFRNALFFLILALTTLHGVAIAAAAINVTRLLPDPTRPRIYAIDKKGKEQGSILVIDTLTHATIKTIPVGKEPSDFDLTENAAELLVMNTTDRSISRIDLTTLAVTKVYQLTEFSNQNDDFGGHVIDGPGNLIYYVDEQWGPRLRVYDTSTGTVLQTFEATSVGTGNDEGFGGIAVNPDKTALYGWVQYGDGAGWAGSFVVRYSIASNGMLTLADHGNANYPTVLNREPFDSPALMTADGSRLIIKNKEVAPNDTSLFPTSYPNTIYSISPNGKIVATSTAILPGKGGEVLATLPVTATVQAMLPDYSAMVYFNTSTNALVWLDLIKTLGAGTLGLTIQPADASTVANPDKLEWFPVTGFLRYQIYLGTGRTEVESATTASASYLGQTADTSFKLPAALMGGQTYFWRVVPLNADGSAASGGVIRSFRVANLGLSRSSITAETVEGVSRHVESISIQSAGAQSWSATADVPWITFENSTGTSPGSLSVIINASTLASGSRSGNITIQSGAETFSIPVNLKLYPANYMIAESDLELPWVYVVSQESNSSGLPSFLLRVNTTTNQIESAVQCGRSVTDLAIHYQENRIYLTNWQTGILRAFDRDTFTQVQTYQFNPAGAAGYSSGDIWAVAAGKKGRLIVEEYDQWINMSLIDTANGSTVSSGFAREGGGRFEPTGRYYFHGDDNSSDAQLTKYDTTAGTFAKLKSSRVDSFSYFGSRRVAMSGDGSRIFWNGGVFDQNLEVKLRFEKEIITSTLHGDLLFSESTVYNGTSGLVLASLPVTTKVMGVTGDQKKLYLFPAGSKAFKTVDLSTISTLPPRQMVPDIADGSTVIGTSQSLGWGIEPFATSYQIYFGTNRDAVANATQSSSEYLGSSLTNTWSGALPALALDGNYFWRVDVIGFSGTRKGETWSFNVAPLTTDPVKMDLSLPVGAPLSNRTLVISGPVGREWTASTSSSWLKVGSTSGTTPGSLVVEVNVAGLAVGRYQGSVTFASGTDTWNLPVSLELLALNYVLAEADREATYIYAISQAASGTDDRAFMVVIDTQTNAISQVVPVGRSVTDLAVHYQENRIYLSNWRTGKLLVLDRDTFKEVKTYSYGAAGGYGTSSGDVYKVAAGKSGRVVIEQEDQWINFFLIDTVTGNKLATGYAGEGGGVFDPSGRYYYHGEDNSSGAGIQKYDTSSDSFVKLASNRVYGFSYYGSRRILTSGDGSSIYWNGGVFDQDLKVRLQLTNEVVSSTYHGELVFTDKTANNGTSGENLATLPVTTSIQGVSADQKKLFLFKNNAFTVVDIAAITAISPRGLIPGIADGSTVIGTEQELSWLREAGALSYNVYFGTSAEAVAAADKTSPEFLGNTSGIRWPGALPVLEFGKNYWWRVDIVGFNSTVAGTVWSFRIPVIDVMPKAVDLAFPADSPVPTQRLNLTSGSGGGSSVAWTASTNTPWIVLKNTTGAAPGNFDFDVNISGMAAGGRQGSITFTAAGDTFSVPVNLRIIALNVTKLVAHPTRPVVYGINTAGAGEGFSHLLEIDAATSKILRSMPIGLTPTDADIDAVNDRLYVSNWGYGQTRVIDLSSWAELAPLSLGTDVYKVEATARGRIVTEGEDQWINLALWNAATGLNLNSVSSLVREGDGESDPTGKFYYHADDNSSGAVVIKYDISGDKFVQVATGPQFGYGSRNLVLCGDGSRLFWLGRVMDDNLHVLGQLPGEVYATTRKGELAIGAGEIWWSDSGIKLVTLPFESPVAVLSANDSNLVRFNPATKSLQSTLLSSIADLPGAFPHTGQSVDKSPERLSWSPVAGATGYRVFIASDAGTLAAMTSPVATVSSPFYVVSPPLAFGRFYSWRVDAVTPRGLVPGKVQSFGIRFPEGAPVAPIGGSDPGASIGVSVAISDQQFVVGGSGSMHSYDFNEMTGASGVRQNFKIAGDLWSSEDPLSADAGKIAVGHSSYQAGTLESAGAAFVYREGGFGYLQSGDPLLLSPRAAGDLFGSGLASSGNQMLVGTGLRGNGIGRVGAYVTEPSSFLLQTFSADDGVINDGFGAVIAMEGNQAIISAPGGGPSRNRVPALYAFTRSLHTGLWNQTQKIAISGASAYSECGTVVAFSGKYLATNNGNVGSVELYMKNGDGQWISSGRIKRSAISGSSGPDFGRALAISGDMLFIGDGQGASGSDRAGAVFSFRLSGSDWQQGPVITPKSSGYSRFGSALAARDGWLLAVGTGPQPAWLFQVRAAANHTPHFKGEIPSQVVAGRPLSTSVLAEDADGNGGLKFDLLQGPYWLAITPGTDGRATLTGTPPESTDLFTTVQIRVRDAAGAQALYTYQLTSLAPTSLPVLTMEPTGETLGEGQELILRAAVSGIGPFKWQWYFNGRPIPGANADRLTLGEISMADAGVYNVVVSNVVGQDKSAGATVAVHTANRFAGDWPTFGGSERHTGFRPARLGKLDLAPAWSAVVSAGHPLNRAVTGDGKVYVTPQIYFGGSFGASALDLYSGVPAWNHPFTETFSINPPTYHDGRVYIQQGQGIGSGTPQLVSLDSDSGSLKWSSTFGAQWERYESPTVTDAGIWVNGGTYGGMYGFSLTGHQNFFQELAQYDGWTPTVSSGRLFTWVAGLFQEHNPVDGTPLWSLNTDWDWRGWTMNSVAAVSGDSAIVISTTEIICIDLPSRSIRWRKSGAFQGSPAMAGEWVYGIQDTKIVSYSLADGTQGPVVTVPETIISGQPLVVMDYLFVAGAVSTYVIDRATSTVVKMLPGGGLLSFGQGRLFAAGADGTLRAWTTGQSMEFSYDPSPIVANAAADDSWLDLGTMIGGARESETLRWEIIGNTNSNIFSKVGLDQKGLLKLSYAPYAGGSSNVTVRVTNASGVSATTTVRVTLPALPAPSVKFKRLILNKLTGFYEQQVTVKNVAGRPIPGFTLTIKGLPAGFSLRNGATAKKGGGTYIYKKPLGAKKSITLTLKYYSAKRGNIPVPKIGVNLTKPTAAKALNRAALLPPVIKPFAITSCLMRADRSVALEFPAEPGRNYRVHYSSDAAHWKACPETITATGTTIQWIDRGPPSTECAPASAPSRFYRIERLDP
jgi:glutamine cyclotransferase